MSAEEALTRRQVLVLLGAGGALALGGVAAVVTGRDGDDGAPSSAQLDAALRVLGQAVLAAHPAVLDDDRLGDDVSAAEVLDRPAVALQALQERIQDDHAAGRTLDVDGWVLSRTECYVAARYARG